MNSLLGSRIKSLRSSKGFTQEYIAGKMGCTRQKYARLEKGLIDISYASISAISQALSVKAEEITSAVNAPSVVEPMFGINESMNREDKFEFILNLLDTFYAHRRLYSSIKKVDGDE